MFSQKIAVVPGGRSFPVKVLKALIAPEAGLPSFMSEIRVLPPGLAGGGPLLGPGWPENVPMIPKIKEPQGFLVVPILVS